MLAPIAVNPKREGTHNATDDRRIEKLTHRLIEQTFLSPFKVGGGTRMHAQSAIFIRVRRFNLPRPRHRGISISCRMADYRQQYYLSLIHI